MWIAISSIVCVYIQEQDFFKSLTNSLFLTIINTKSTACSTTASVVKSSGNTLDINATATFFLAAPAIDFLYSFSTTANSRQFGNLHALLQHDFLQKCAERCRTLRKACRTVRDSAGQSGKFMACLL